MTPSLDSIREAITRIPDDKDRATLRLGFDRALRVAMVANQLAGALERADDLNTSARYCRSDGRNPFTHRERSLAALKAYSDL